MEIVTVSLHISSISENSEKKAICWICHTFWKTHHLLKKEVEIIGISLNTLLQTHLSAGNSRHLTQDQWRHLENWKTIGWDDAVLFHSRDALPASHLLSTLVTARCTHWAALGFTVHSSLLSLLRDICLHGCSSGPQGNSGMRGWAAQGGRSVLHLPLPPHSSTTPLAKQLLDWRGKLLKPLQANLPHDSWQSPYFKISLSNLFWSQIPFYYFFLTNSVAWGMLLMSEVVHGITRTHKIPSYGWESTCGQA